MAVCVFSFLKGLLSASIHDKSAPRGSGGLIKALCKP